MKPEQKQSMKLERYNEARQIHLTLLMVMILFLHEDVDKLGKEGAMDKWRKGHRN